MSILFLSLSILLIPGVLPATQVAHPFGS